MEGRIVAVLETWPLQLTVEGSDGLWSVALSTDTRITHNARPVAPTELRPGRRIVATGRQSSLRSMIAEVIDLP